MGLREQATVGCFRELCFPFFCVACLLHVKLDGWCEGGLRQQRNDGGGCVTMRERSERVESPGTYVTE